MTTPDDGTLSQTRDEEEEFVLIKLQSFQRPVRTKRHTTHLMEYEVPVLLSSMRPFSILYGRENPVPPFSTSSLN